MPSLLRPTAYKATQLACLIGLGAALTAIFPRLTVAWLLALGLAALPFANVRARLGEAVAGRDALAIAFLVLLLYLLLNASWAVDPAAAYGKVGALALFVAAAVVVTWGLQGLDARAVDRVAALFLAGFCLGLAALAFEVASDRLVARTLYNVFPWTRPDHTKLLNVVDGVVVAAGLPEINRHIGLLTLTAWPALSLFLRREQTPARAVVLAAAAAALIFTVFGSAHQSSQIALVGGVLAYAASYWSARNVRAVLAGLWCAAFVLVVPLASLAYHQLELHTVSWLPDSARARIIIWSHTAERTADNIWLGVGVRSTRFLNAPDTDALERPENHIIEPRTGQHAHNIYLQSWFELGAVGAALVMTCGLLLFLRTARLRAPVQPAANATFAAFALISASAWGMWQTWLMAGGALIVVYVVLAAEAAPQPPGAAGEGGRRR